MTPCLMSIKRGVPEPFDRRPCSACEAISVRGFFFGQQCPSKRIPKAANEVPKTSKWCVAVAGLQGRKKICHGRKILVRNKYGSHFNDTVAPGRGTSQSFCHYSLCLSFANLDRGIHCQSADAPLELPLASPRQHAVSFDPALNRSGADPVAMLPTRNRLEPWAISK